MKKNKNEIFKSKWEFILACVQYKLKNSRECKAYIIYECIEYIEYAEADI